MALIRKQSAGRKDKGQKPRRRTSSEDSTLYTAYCMYTDNLLVPDLVKLLDLGAAEPPLARTAGEPAVHCESPAGDRILKKKAYTRTYGPLRGKPFIYDARESSLVPEGFLTAQFLQKLYIYETICVDMILLFACLFLPRQNTTCQLVPLGYGGGGRGQGGMY